MPGYETELQKERDMKDKFMAQHPESPFIIGDVAGFTGLRYFPIDPKYRVPAVLQRMERPPEAVLRTNRDGQLTCRYIGDMHFELDGQNYALRVFHAGEQVGLSVFIPFRDSTSGKGSYAPGRYLMLQLTEEDEYTLDFNLAFNPYCAYTERYECGYPPPENDLPTPIQAGEMAWSAPTGPEPAPVAVSSAPHPPRRPAPKTPRAAARVRSKVPRTKPRRAPPKRSTRR
jgi:hypothetical protein